MKKILQQLKSQFKKHPKRILFGWYGMPLVTFLEMILVGSIYLILNPKRLEAFEKSVLSRLDQFPMIHAIGINQVSLLGVSLVVLLFYVWLRALYLKNKVHLEHVMYVGYARQMVRAYLNSPVETVAKISNEKIILSIMNDAKFIGMACSALLRFSGTLAAFTLYLIMGATLSLQMLLLGGGIYFISFSVSRWGYRKMEVIGARKVKLEQKLLHFLKEFTFGHKRIILDGAEEDLMDQSDTIIEKSDTWRVDKGVTRALIEALNEGVAMLGLFLVIYFGIGVIHIALPKLLILFVIFNRIKTYASTMSRSYVEMKVQLPNLYNYQNIMSQLGDPRDLQFGVGLKDMDWKHVELKNVSFQYDKKPVLENVSIRFDGGDRIMIQGPSGGGKSTFLDLISGLLKPGSGTILVDQTPFDLRLFYEIRHQIAYVSSRLFLFQGSIRKNLTLGKNVSEDRVYEAVSKAGLEECIGALPKGLDEPIGMDGIELSVGQRARVIMARLFLQKPRLIILDEATTNVDEELEKSILDNLLRFVPSASIFIFVSHQIPRGIQFNKYLEIKDRNITPKEGYPICLI